MDNQSYLSKYINAADFFSGETKAIAIGRYEDMVFLYTSKYYEKITGHYNVVGHKLRDTSVSGAEYSNFFRNIGLKLKDKADRFSYIVIYKSPLDNLRKCYFITLSLISNPHTGDIVGRLIEIEYLNIDFLNQILNLISNLMQSKPLQENVYMAQLEQQINLTEREKQVLFLLITGRTYKQIAATLSRLTPKQTSATTIATIINRQLLPKFEVTSTEDLIDKVASMGLFVEIPSSLIEQSEGVYSTFGNIL